METNCVIYWIVIYPADCVNHLFKQLSPGKMRAKIANVGKPMRQLWGNVLQFEWNRNTLWHPRRPRGSQSGREKRRDESFQAQAEEPLGTDSQRTISKPSSECWLLIGHKKCFVLLCPIGEQHLLSSFREFVHDGFWLDHALSGSCTKQMHAVRKLWALSI